MKRPEREAGQRQWKAAGQVRVVRDPQFGHVGQFAQSARKLSPGPVAAQVERHDQAEGVRRHAVPFVECGRLEPTTGMRPVRTPGGLVQQVEHAQVRLVAVRSGGILHRSQPVGKAGNARRAETLVSLEVKTRELGKIQKAPRDRTRQAV